MCGMYKIYPKRVQYCPGLVQIVPGRKKLASYHTFLQSLLRLGGGGGIGYPQLIKIGTGCSGSPKNIQRKPVIGLYYQEGSVKNFLF